MIKKDPKKFADGTVKTQVRVVYGYRDENGKVKQKTLKDFGYLEDADNEESFMNVVNEYNKNALEEKRTVIHITNKKRKPFYESDESKTTNFGYKYLESIYDELGLEDFFIKLDNKCEYNLNKVLKYLVIQRILKPDSKRATFQSNEILYGMNCDFSLQNIYRSLTYFSSYSLDIQEYLNKIIKEKVGRDNEKMFYDVTNYSTQRDYETSDIYVEVVNKITDKKILKEKKVIEVKIDNEMKQYIPVNGLFKKGVSKDHSLDPIVQMGLFIDENGLPVAMNIFPGNTSDSKTLIPIMKEIKNKFKLNRIIVVADKGLNSSDNISYSSLDGNGYMFSQILRGKKGKRYQERLFNEDLYTVVDQDYKYQLFDEEFIDDNQVDEKGKKIKVTKKRKVLIYYSGEDAKRTKIKREKDIEKLKKDIMNNAYGIVHGKKRYLVETKSVEETGEVANKTDLSISTELIEEDEKYDGYFCIITSELDYTEKQIRETYHGLWRIEESFKITKTDFLASPIYLRDEEHVRGHFLMCYVALLVIRLLQNKMDYELSTERIVKALKMCSCSEIDNGVIHVIMTDTYKRYIEERTIDGKKEYKTLELSTKDSETVKDFKEIIKYYEGDVCNSVEPKYSFDNYLTQIKIRSLKKSS